MMVGFLRQTELPIIGNTPYTTMSRWLSNMGQTVLNPPTIFGWDEKRLAGESYVLEWRNAIIDFVNRDNQVRNSQGNLVNERALYRLKFLPGNESTDGLISRVASTLGIELNAAQRASLYKYVRNEYDCPRSDLTTCNGEAEYLTDIGEPSSTVVKSDSKVRGLVALMTMLPEYRLK